MFFLKLFMLLSPMSLNKETGAMLDIWTILSAMLKKWKQVLHVEISKNKSRKNDRIKPAEFCTKSAAWKWTLPSRENYLLGVFNGIQKSGNNIPDFVLLPDKKMEANTKA